MLLSGGGGAPVAGLRGLLKLRRCLVVMVGRVEWLGVWRRTERAAARPGKMGIFF